MLRITALMDDMPGRDPALRAEHGLSFLVELSGRRILFDCGSGSGTRHNAEVLGLELEALDAVAISHSHYDHAGGFRDLVEGGLRSRVLYTGPHFFEPKLSWDGERRRDLSAGFGPDFLRDHGIAHCPVEGICQILPGAYLIGGFPRTHFFERIPQRFLRHGPEGIVPDDFSDEICMAIQIPGGLAVLVGCSHPGILNMLTHVRRVLGKPILGVFGGTHLAEADGERVHETLRSLEALGVQRLGLCHCSGAAVRDGRIALGESIRYERKER